MLDIIEALLPVSANIWEEVTANFKDYVARTSRPKHTRKSLKIKCKQVCAQYLIYSHSILINSQLVKTTKPTGVSICDLDNEDYTKTVEEHNHNKGNKDDIEVSNNKSNLHPSSNPTMHNFLHQAHQSEGWAWQPYYMPLHCSRWGPLAV